MFNSKGILQYFNLGNDKHKLWLLIEDEIGKYYRSLIPYNVNSPKHPTHISIIRGEVLKPERLKLWHDKEIKFEYDGIIYNDETYWWLHAYSEQLESVRMDLGLKPTGDVTVSPDGKHAWHITIANNKNWSKDD